MNPVIVASRDKASSKCFMWKFTEVLCQISCTAQRTFSPAVLLKFAQSREISRKLVCLIEPLGQRKGM